MSKDELIKGAPVDQARYEKRTGEAIGTEDDSVESDRRSFSACSRGNAKALRKGLNAYWELNTVFAGDPADLVGQCV